MRRRYAFEAEGVPEKVENALEKLEDQVDQHCDTVADCEAAEKKIDDKIGEFDGALQAMAGAAKDCKDGKCSKEEMGETIKSSMTDLKKLAGEIGVANESDSELASEDEIKDAKVYLEGAKEIIEAKKDELESGSSEEGGSSDEGEGGDDDEASAEECDAIESFVDACLEAYLDDLETAMEGEIFDMAMEGTTSDAVSSFMQHKSQIRSIKSEMNAAAKAKNYTEAAAKAKQAAGVCDDLINDINNLPAQSVSKAVLVNIAMGVAALIVMVAAKGAGKALLGAAKGGAGKMGDAIAKHAPQKLKAKAAGAAAAREINKNAKVTDKMVQKATKAGEKAGQKALDAKMKGAKAELGIGVGNKAKNAVKGAAGAVGSLGGKAKATMSKAGATITSHAVMMPGADKVYDAASAVKGAAGKVAGSKAGQVVGKGVGAAAGAAKGAMKPGVAGAAAGAAASAGAVVFLKKKGVVDADGNATSSALDGKDINGLINLIKIDAKRLKQRFLDQAAAYEEMASSSSSSSATESFMEAVESFMIAAVTETEPAEETAMESETDFDSFLDNLWD